MLDLAGIGGNWQRLDESFSARYGVSQFSSVGGGGGSWCF